MSMRYNLNERITYDSEFSELLLVLLEFLQELGLGASAEFIHFTFSCRDLVCLSIIVVRIIETSRKSLFFDRYLLFSNLDNHIDNHDSNISFS